MEIISNISEALKTDTLHGLSANPKYLLSKYFYDEEGSRIFQQIMEMPEYYLTNCEFEILSSHKEQIRNDIAFSGEFDLIELGAGDGLKTKILLNHFLNSGDKFNYIPIDISFDAVNKLLHSLKNEIPGIQITGKVGDYFEMLEELNEGDHRSKLILFLGSNIGNYTEDEAMEFLSQIEKRMNKNDILLLGMDLKKDPAVIMEAYNDKHGISRDFNLNLLKRLNRELGANFNTRYFVHAPHYNAASGIAYSYLVSTKDQIVYFEELDTSFRFHAWEAIHTEISQKYDRQMIEKLAQNSGLKIKNQYFDRDQYFTNVLLIK